jgi:hypothetical protein
MEKKIKDIPAALVENKDVPDFMKEIENDLSNFKEEIQVEQPDPVQVSVPEKKKRGRKPKDKFEQDITEKRVVSDTIINGALLLLFIDVVIPNLIAMINNKMSKKKIKASRLAMTEGQKRELQPIADEAARAIQLQGNPITILAFSIVSIYATNLLLIKTE